jgi:hypothetical protein
VLAGEIELEDIDTEPFNVYPRPQADPAVDQGKRDMIAGVVGRPDAQSVSGS